MEEVLYLRVCWHCCELGCHEILMGRLVQVHSSGYSAAMEWHVGQAPDHYFAQNTQDCEWTLIGLELLVPQVHVTCCLNWGEVQIAAFFVLDLSSASSLYFAFVGRPQCAVRLLM